LVEGFRGYLGGILGKFFFFCFVEVLKNHFLFVPKF
jgi:hypothetical protein